MHHDFNAVAENKTCPECPIDIAFLIDGSDSIEREDFDLIKSWIIRTVNDFKPWKNDKSLFLSVVQFSRESVIEVQGIINSGPDEVRSLVEGIKQKRSGTKAYSGLNFVNRNVYPKMRSNSYKILITMTDGKANEDRNIAAIKQAHNNYNMMMAVGVSEKVDQDKLLDFSSNETLIFKIENFGALGGIISRIVEKICLDIGEGIVQYFKFCNKWFCSIFCSCATSRAKVNLLFSEKNQ